MNYTKGEWKVSGLSIEADYRGLKCEVAKLTPFFPETSRANAQLIAAAPDMYEALKTLNEQLLGANIPFSQDMFDAKRNARQALGKAEGK